MTRGRTTHSSEGDEYFFEEGCFILELWNQPDDPQVSVARARVPPHSETRWHSLDGITERYLILSGKGEASVADRTEAVGPGSAILIPPGTAQKISNTGAEDLVFLAVCSPRFEHDRYQDLGA